MPISVSLIEDDAEFRQTIEDVIRGAPDLRCVSSHFNGEDALRRLETAQPEVVLVDIKMPHLSGIECVRQLRRQIPALLPIMLTLYADDELIFGSLQAGAVGYLLKRSTPDEIRNAIREVHAGGSPMTPEIARRVALHFHQPQAASPGGANHGLTPREDEILRLIAQGRQTKEIARGLDIAVSTVSNHLRSIYAKLEVTSRVAAVAKMRPR